MHYFGSSAHNETERILPYFLQPQEDELFSSWLLRNSIRHKTKTHSFAKFLWSEENIWTRDIDKIVSQEILHNFAAITNTSVGIAMKTTLRSYEGIISERINTHGLSRWILSAGIYHRSRSKHGLQYCPICINTANPYYKTWWRLSFFVCCRKCEVMLLDACPHCAAPVIPFRLEVGNKTGLTKYPLNCCYKCQKSLYEGNGILKPVEPALLRFTNEITETLEGAPSSVAKHPILFFNGIFILSGVLRSQSPVQRSGYLSGAQMNPYSSRIFDSLRHNERKEILIQVAQLMQNWPLNLLNLFKELDLTFSNLWPFIKNKEDIPYWLYDILRSEFSVMWSNPKYKKRKRR